MAEAARTLDDLDPLVAPDETIWRAMSPRQRESYIISVHAALNERRDLMTEGQPHFRAKSRALDMLGRHFRRIGRRVYVASEMAVLYPGEPVINPDLIAVLDVDDPGNEDDREAWVVADEGKGPEFALEVHFKGSEEKDFVRNVKEYARLGIQEYFIYDRRRQALVGYRLLEGERKYERAHVRFGRFHSRVLGLDLQVRAGRLRFYAGDAELPDSEELIDRIETLVDDLALRRSEAEARAEQEQARAEQEQARAEQEQARAEQEQARAEQEQSRADQVLEDLRSAVLDILDARGTPLSEELRSRVRACTDSATLRTWAIRAGTGKPMDEVFA